MSFTPLRYPGGKAQYTPILCTFADIVPHSRYIEPFAGGAAIALHFAIQRATPVIINDKDPAIYAFWYSVVHQNEVFIERIRSVRVDIDAWHWAKYIMSQKYASILDTGFAAFFLNRCNFSGCLKANPIGGLYQKGKWQLDSRFNKERLIHQIQLIGRYHHLIEVSCLDAIDLIEKKVGGHDLLYLDPPYYTQGRKLYSNYMNNSDHEHLYHTLQKTSAYWLMSYDDNSYIRNLYSGYVLRNKGVRYSFLNKINSQELLISARNLIKY